MGIDFWDQSNPTNRILLGALGSLTGALVLWLLRLSWVWLKSRNTRLKKLKTEISSLKGELGTLQKRLHGAEKAVEGDGLWLARPLVQPDHYAVLLQQSIPIITVANLKGGVGKTTLTAHLARFYAGIGKRVLAIDLDYQGSLSNLAAQGDVPSSRVSNFVAGEFNGPNINELAWPMENAPGYARILTSYYELARIENQVLVHWLTQREERDARYFLAAALLTQDVQESYDIILIDAAPRITTSTVQALCTSTNVLIPTKLDAVSADAVGYFVEQLFIMEKLWPFLNLAGVVGTMTENNIGALSEASDRRDPMIDFEQDAIFRIQQRLDSTYDAYSKSQPPSLILPHTTFIPGKRDISRLANEQFSEASDVSPANRLVIEAAFDRLGRELANRVNLQI